MDSAPIRTVHVAHLKEKSYVLGPQPLNALNPKTGIAHLDAELTSGRSKEFLNRLDEVG